MSDKGKQNVPINTNSGWIAKITRQKVIKQAYLSLYIDNKKHNVFLPRQPSSKLICLRAKAKTLFSGTVKVVTSVFST